MAKLNVCVVTGYIPIVNHPRGVEEYGRLGEGLRGIQSQLIPYYIETPRQTWLARCVESLPEKVSWAQGDNAAKNSLEYHAVQHEKISWVARAAAEHPDYDSYVWIDYGILRLPGVTPAVIDEFLKRLKKNDLAIPGCWERMDPRVEHTIESEYFPCWRFCGSMFVVPQYMARSLGEAWEAFGRMRLRATRKVTWEVNDMALMERHLPKLPIRWYKADHNALMFTQYAP